MFRKLARGFTLIELMIVVAIIGILALIAIPDFTKFQNKAKQSEAKTNLKAFFTAAKSNFAENGTYSCGWCNYAPEKNYKYNYYNGVAADNLTTSGQGCDATNVTEGQAQTAFTAGAGMTLSSCDQWKIDDANNLLNVTPGI
jgi:prepilin-type N-terminal cleavage/methylation domain-containing protein